MLPLACRGARIAALGLGCCVLAARQTVPQQPALPTLTRSEGLVALDYEVIPVKGGASIDLMGFHYLKPLTGWLYVGVGGHAPLVRGDYGGFMAFDATVHAQWPLAGNLFLEGGLSLGGGGGGKSIRQSATLSGSGRYLKAYAGLGYRFQGFSAGIDYTGFRFAGSAIDHAQLGVFLQVPFSFSVGPYGRSEDPGSSLSRPAADRLFADSGESTFSQGLARMSQIRPKGGNKGPLDLLDVQFSHFPGRDWYLFVEGSAGYRGLPAYNQLFGGIGYRIRAGSRIRILGQVAVGSGGYSPDLVDTGPGLLVHPKVSVEYAFTRNWGVSLSGGYLFAPRGTSKNAVIGASLQFHPFSPRMDMAGEGGSDEVVLRDRRLNVFVQAELHPQVGDHRRGSVDLLTAQYDSAIRGHWYLPLQVGVAFVGYPGYGEILAGVGAQTPDRPGATGQGFVQVLVGANLFGFILKPEAGLLWGLGPHAALRLSVGRTVSLDGARSAEYPESHRWRSTNVGLGLSYRFSLPN